MYSGIFSHQSDVRSTVSWFYITLSVHPTMHVQSHGVAKVIMKLAESTRIRVDSVYWLFVSTL